MEVVVGVDIGDLQHEGRAGHRDGTGAGGRAAPAPDLAPPARVGGEDAERVWWADVQEICHRLVAQAPGPIAGVCVSGVGPSLVLCDADLTPLRPAILYGIDSRATEEIALINARYGEEAILADGGKLLSSQALGPKLEWVRRHEPEVWRAARGRYGSHSFIVAKLTGENVLDHSTASQCDPLYRVPSFGWHHEWAMEICARSSCRAWPGPAR